MNIKKLCLPAALFLTALFLLAGCKTLASIKSGQFVARGEVRKAFEEGQVNPAYMYYYSGSDAHPIAILGVDKTVKFDTGGLWKPIKNPSENLPPLVKGMDDRVLGLMQVTWGYSLLDDTGKQIGVWYSIPSGTTAVIVREDGTVMIYTPPIDTYLKLERETR
jgi:hypothetical protein